MNTADTNSYSVRALYDVIKISLLLKDKDLVHFIRTMNDNILEEFEKLQKNINLPLNDIMNKYENYSIVFMMVRSIMYEAHISGYQEKTREITNYLLTDELYKKSDKPTKSVYDDED